MDIEMEKRPLWSDETTEDHMEAIYDKIMLRTAVFNLYQDIKCLKEDLEELRAYKQSAESKLKEYEQATKLSGEVNAKLMRELLEMQEKLAAMESQEPAVRINTIGGGMQWNPNYKGEWSGEFYSKPVPADKPAVAVPDVNYLASTLMDAWKFAEPSHGVTANMTSYVSTFVDMARAVINQHYAAAPSHGQQSAQSVPLATVMDLRAYMDEFGKDADLNVIRSELGEMILRANGTYYSRPIHDKNTQDTPKA